MDTIGTWTTAQSLPLHMAGVKATSMSPTGREMSAAAVAAMLSQGGVLPGATLTFEGGLAAMTAPAVAMLLANALVPVGTGPIGVAITPNGSFAYVANNGDSTVSVIDTATNLVTATVTGLNGPIDVAITPNGNFAYVTNGSGNTVSVIDTSTNTITGLPITVGANPFEIDITPDGAFAYVANHGSGTVSVIDTSTNLSTATITVGSLPNGVAVSPDGLTVYVTNSGSGTVSVIDTGTNLVTATVAVGSTPIGVAFTPDGNFAYVANNGSSTVSVIDTTTGPPSVVTTISGFGTPAGVAVSPDGTRVFVVNFGTNNVSVIDTGTNTILTTLTVGTQPSRDAVTPDGNFLYVTNNGSNNVSVLQIRPIVTSITPASGSTLGGEPITISGSGFTGATAVTLNSTPVAGFVVVDDNTITAITPAHAAGTVQASVTVPLGTGTGGSFTFVVPAPVITSISPASGTTSGGTLVTITGTNSTGATAVSIAGTPVTSFQVVDDTHISAITAPHAPGTGLVSVTTPGGTATGPVTYTYVTPAPTISGFTPASGSTAGGTQVTITGTGFTGTTAVSLAGAPAASFQVLNDTTIVAITAPHAPASGPVTVTTPGGTAISATNYTYVTQAPTVTAIFPTSGPAGASTQVAISGTGLSGATSVTVNGTPVPFTVISDNQITATLPPHAAGTVAVTVTTPGGSASIPFTYTGDRTRLTATPAIVQIFPPHPYAGILTATLTDLDTGQPLAGQPVTFTTGSTTLCTSVTDAQGVAVCPATLALPLIILNGGYTATYAGNASHQPATAHGAVITV
ncbi:IPT/TIG domain-containing protein [Streptomyces sp. NPDC060232]|uniref:IPT/TIG domain-containing protein n=1 Tax=Streptomyces sp. NPDC060232 TaxID=3347079 RepID=UPI00366413C5